MRHRLAASLFLLTGLVAASCSLGQAQDRAASQGRIAARPRVPAVAPAPGFSALAIGRGERDGLLFIPRSAAAGPVPLVVLLHGAGGSAQGIRRRLFGASDSIDFALLIPDSRGPTWDAIRRDYGPDVAFIDSALKVVFSRIAIDPKRVIVSGFSDGASYALGLGRVNGDLFTRVVAFSPGFVTGGSPTGKPEVFITHGDDDPILPFEATSGRIVPAMRRSGYTITLKRFTGGHAIPPEVVREAFLWAISSDDQRR